MTEDVLIVGAGIVGAACAAEFASAGLRVVVLDADIVAGGATAAAMGHVAVMDDSSAQFALTRYSQMLWKQLAETLPESAEYVEGGAIWVAADSLEMAEVYRKAEHYGAQHVGVEVLDEQALREAEPNLREGLAGGLLLCEDAVLDPCSAARYLVQQAERNGAVIKTGHRVVELGSKGVRLADGTVLEAGAVIVANGTAAKTLLPELSLQRRKGHLLITEPYPGFVRRQVIELGYLRSAHLSDTDSVAFNVQPRKSGQVLIGSSRQYGAQDSAVEAGVLSRMLARAVAYMPAIQTLSKLRSWTGFRAATPDKLPLIGAYSPLPNVYLATGHEGLGITASLGTAKLIADELLGRASAIPREPYSPQRTACL